MSAKRFEPNPYDGREEFMRERITGDFVHFSDYDKLVEALRMIRRDPAYNQEIAEAALLSAGERL
jgi:hypothetical protein